MNIKDNLSAQVIHLRFSLAQSNYLFQSSLTLNISTLIKNTFKMGSKGKLVQRKAYGTLMRQICKNICKQTYDIIKITPQD